MGGSDAALSRPKRVNDIIEMAVNDIIEMAVSLCRSYSK